jgi:hypothetical protein
MERALNEGTLRAAHGRASTRLDFCGNHTEVVIRGEKPLRPHSAPEMA